MKKIVLISLLFIVANSLFALPPVAANRISIHGMVRDEDSALPFVSVLVKGTTLGVVTSETGEYILNNVPQGDVVLQIMAVGYKSSEKVVSTSLGDSPEINFKLSKDRVGLEQVVVTADRNQRDRKEALTVVNTISPKLMEQSNSITLSEGLCFSSGLRMEDNCQNCGFTQVRMNGMEGPYSQILINSRPIFSGLAGVYGLELIPATMIERIEVVKGGGSALYGSNAIAGTINLITKDPLFTNGQASFDYSSVGQTGEGGKPSNDFSGDFNGSWVSKDYTTGVSLFGFVRDRDPFDANGDGFSEVVKVRNYTVGSRIYRKLGLKGKLTFDYFHIDDDRRGGNDFSLQPHQADIAESAKHKINTGAISYDQFLENGDKLSLYFSTQHIKRDSYYGAGEDPAGYGTTKDLTFSTGTQLNHHFDKFVFQNGDLTSGFEYTQDNLLDNKDAYTDGEGFHDETTIADQTLSTYGVYLQQQWDLDKLKFGVGVRYDHYQIKDPTNNDSNLNGDVISPRINALYNLLPNFQLRASYSQGYRAPQVFDEDLHIEASTARKVIHKNASNLKQENSRSWSGSIAWSPKTESTQMEVMVEGFVTQLNNPFVITYGEPDENRVVIYTRENAKKGALIQGINWDANVAVSNRLVLQVGYTIQSSRYKEAQEDFNEKAFYRTPNHYGFLTLNYSPYRKWDLSLSGTYTGKMKVPYFGPNAPVDESGEILGVLRESNPFADLGFKTSYDFTLSHGVCIKAHCGIKNIFNSYQEDFDIGDQRDPSYIYGPSLPRTIYCGIAIGNLL